MLNNQARKMRLSVHILVIYLMLKTTSGEGVCSKYAGFIAENRIENIKFTSSSQASEETGPSKVLLNGPSFWMRGSDDEYPWIQIDLVLDVSVFGVITQGGSASASWISKFSIQCITEDKRVEEAKNVNGNKIFSANSLGEDEYVINMFSSSVRGRYMRLNAIACQNDCTLRLELIVCSKYADMDRDNTKDEISIPTEQLNRKMFSRVIRLRRNSGSDITNGTIKTEDSSMLNSTEDPWFWNITEKLHIITLNSTMDLPVTGETNLTTPQNFTTADTTITSDRQSTVTEVQPSETSDDNAATITDVHATNENGATAVDGATPDVQPSEPSNDNTAETTDVHATEVNVFTVDEMASGSSTDSSNDNTEAITDSHTIINDNGEISDVHPSESSNDNTAATPDTFASNINSATVDEMSSGSSYENTVTNENGGMTDIHPSEASDDNIAETVNTHATNENVVTVDEMVSGSSNYYTEEITNSYATYMNDGITEVQPSEASNDNTAATSDTYATNINVVTVDEMSSRSSDDNTEVITDSYATNANDGITETQPSEASNDNTAATLHIQSTNENDVTGDGMVSGSSDDNTEAITDSYATNANDGITEAQPSEASNDNTAATLDIQATNENGVTGDGMMSTVTNLTQDSVLSVSAEYLNENDGNQLGKDDVEMLVSALQDIASFDQGGSEDDIRIRAKNVRDVAENLFSPIQNLDEDVALGVAVSMETILVKSAGSLPPGSNFTLHSENTAVNIMNIDSAADAQLLVFNFFNSDSNISSTIDESKKSSVNSLGYMKVAESALDGVTSQIGLSVIYYDKSVFDSTQSRNKKEIKSETEILASGVISCSVFTNSEIQSVAVEFALEYDTILSQESEEEDGIREEKTTTCSFWDTYSETWSTKGCEVTLESNSLMQCACDHTTNFGIVVQVEQLPSTIDLATIVYVFIIIGLILLFIALFIILWVTFYTRESWLIVHANLILSLLLAFITFLAGIEDTHTISGCRATAIFLHFFLLVFFMWILLEGIYLHFTMITPFPQSRKILIVHIVAGWCLPLVITFLSMAGYYDGYGTEEVCWLSADKGFLAAYILPVVVIMLCCISCLMFINYNQNKGIYKAINHQEIYLVITLRDICVVCVLAGCTWLFGGLTTKHINSLGYQLFFAIFGLILSVYLLIFFGIRNHLRVLPPTRQSPLLCYTSGKTKYFIVEIKWIDNFCPNRFWHARSK
ncbi:adhesion G protein-coupled receptor L3-like [Anneissia japonica]|uniref:adhesion G protein-coupled receptor L3-like n=1 Tax=Anneissia japonica TaxID=1529436 RepID=UPI00142560B9|nr:adhesion G protein-coupled receptor L3-like [Anneissia japonica]